MVVLHSEAFQADLLYSKQRNVLFWKKVLGSRPGTNFAKTGLNTLGIVYPHASDDHVNVSSVLLIGTQKNHKGITCNLVVSYY